MDTEKKKVLIIDDQEEIRDLVIATLCGSEFEVFEAAIGRIGIQFDREQKPDLILLDVIMPGFDGFTMCKIIKRNPDIKDIPVIFLTAKKIERRHNKCSFGGRFRLYCQTVQPQSFIDPYTKNSGYNTSGKRP